MSTSSDVASVCGASIFTVWTLHVYSTYIGILIWHAEAFRHTPVSSEKTYLHAIAFAAGENEDGDA